MGEFSVVLMRPEIPHNTGAIGRLCVGLGVPLNLVRPPDFYARYRDALYRIPMPGPPTARVTLFALDEANLPK